MGSLVRGTAVVGCLLVGLVGCGGGGGGSGSNRVPAARISAAPSSGDAPLTVALDGSGSTDPDGSVVGWSWAYGDGATGTGAQTSHTYTTATTFTVTLTVTDDDGATATSTTTITVTSGTGGGTNQAPTAAISVDPTGGEAPVTVSFDGSGSSDIDGTVAAWAWTFGDGSSGSGSTVSHAYTADGTYTVTLTITDDDGATAVTQTSVTITAPVDLPPDPGTVAPGLAPGEASSLAAATRFLTEGADPIQTGADPTVFDDVRAAVVRGRVTDADGQPLAGVGVSINDHLGYGQTRSRADGAFDLRVNGDEALVLRYERTGYLPAQRRITPTRQEFTWLPDVALVSVDPAGTTVTTSGAAGPQIARGSTVSDADGDRRATLILPSGTSASLVQSDGSTVPTDTLTLHLTEYTTGGQGPAAMPGKLPPASGFTYAVELGSEETVAKVNGQDVVLDRPVPFYVENFLGFPVGTVVPVGYYDNTAGQWRASENGRVIEIVSVTGGSATVDVDGDGAADTGQALTDLSITAEELGQLGTLYSVGDTLWRARVSHFSTYDCNWPYGPPSDAQKPGGKAKNKKDKDGACTRAGSILECENQVLGERVPVVGTPFSLNYRSGRMPGFTALHSLEIPLTDAAPPASLERVEFEVLVAGQRHRNTFDAPAANLTGTFTWDGADAYGRPVAGTRTARIRVGYVYNAVYMEPAQQAEAFGQWSGTPIQGSRARGEYTIWTESEAPLTRWDAREQGLGGWSLSIHHVYDPVGRVLYRGNGDRRHADAMPPTIWPFAGVGHAGYTGDEGPALTANLDLLRGLAVAPDGTVYISDIYHEVVRAVAPDGTIRTVAGTGTAGFFGDGGLATAAQLNDPWGLALDDAGNLYIADRSNNRIRRVAPDGTITTVAGTGTRGKSGDGGLATAAQLGNPRGLAFGPDGALYIADRRNGRIRRIGLDGTITTVAGGGSSDPGGPGVPALEADLGSPSDVIFDGGGGLLAVDDVFDRVFRVGPDGRITVLAGGGSPTDGVGDGLPATQAQFSDPEGLAVGPDGSIYVADTAAYRVRRIDPDGTVTTYAGTGSSTSSGDGGPAGSAGVAQPYALAFGPDGTLYVAEANLGYRVRRITSGLPGHDASNLLVASQDGTRVFEFSPEGLHLTTYHALTGAALYSFGYDADGWLASITDGDGRVTTVDRSGASITITAPNGQATGLDLDAEGYLDGITTPGGASWQFTSDTGGLVTDLTDPDGYGWQFTYAIDGRITDETLPGGQTQSLARTTLSDGFEVRFTDGAGGDTTYTVSTDTEGSETRRVADPGGVEASMTFGADGTRALSKADGTLVNVTSGGDPRFGQAAPVVALGTVTTPVGGHTATSSQERTVTLADSGSPLDLVAWEETRVINGRTESLAFEASSGVPGDGTLTRTTPEGRVGTIALDTLGRPTSATFDTLTPVTLAWDQGRLQTIQSGTETSSFTYDATDRLTRLDRPDGTVRQWGYDADNRVTSVTDGGNRAVGLDWTAGGRLASVTLPEGGAYAFTWGLDSRLAEIQPPGGSDPIQLTRDGSGRISQITSSSARTASFTRDTAGRLTAVQTPSTQRSFSYDTTTGQLVSAGWSDGSVSQQWASVRDGFLVTRLAWTGPATGAYDYLYDDDFHLTQVNFGSHQDLVTVDGEDRITTFGPFTYRYTGPDGAVDQVSNSTAALEYGHDGSGRLVSKTLTIGGGVAYQLALTRGAGGRIEGRTETLAGVSHTYAYTYDAYGQLAGVSRDGSVVETYAYDGNGNPTTLPAGSAIYDNRDRITTLGGTSYASDADGFVTGRGTDGFAYAVSGDLLSATVGGSTVTYVHDGFGRRVARTSPTGTESYFYGDLDHPYRVTAYVLENGTEVHAYYDPLGRLFALHQGPAWYYVASDPVGTPLAVFDSSGAPVRVVEREAFGRVLSDTAPGFTLPLGFTGGLEDPLTGWVRFGRRDFDPAAARWTAPDPVLFEGGLRSLYTYAANDPLARTDPEGTQAEGYGPEQLERIKTLSRDWGESTKTNPFQTLEGRSGNALGEYSRPLKEMGGRKQIKETRGFFSWLRSIWCRAANSL